MRSVTLLLLPSTERLLREKAIRQGKSLEAYLQQLADQDATTSNESQMPVDAESLAEFDRGLDELASDLPALPSDFSRADVYIDHD